MAESYEENQLFAELEPVVKGLGFSIVELKARTVKGTMQVHLVIYKPGGITVDDCSLIHKTVQPRMEVVFDIRDISLEVASPGLNRTLKSNREYSLFQGHHLRILTDDNSEWIEGVLVDATDHDIGLERDGKTEKYDLSLIRKAKLAD